MEKGAGKENGPSGGIIVSLVLIEDSVKPAL